MSIVNHRMRARLGVFALLACCACTNQLEPARHAIEDIDAIVTAAAPDGAKYVPDQLANVQHELGELRAEFTRQDYAGVLKGASSVMSAAQGLAGAAAAKKDEAMRELTERWNGFTAVMPGYMTALQHRIDFLGMKSREKMAAGVDLEAARGSLRNAAAVWSKAQAAFAAGNLEEAVTTSKMLKGMLDGLAGTLHIDSSAFTPAAN